MQYTRPCSRSQFIRFGLLAMASVLTAIARDRLEAASPTTVKPSRLQTLSKGFNLGHWQRHSLTDGYYTLATLQQYKRLGLTYTRLPIVLSTFFDNKNPGVLKTDSLAALDAIVRLHAQVGLGIILSPFNHPSSLYFDPAVLAKFVAFFKAFATHMRATDPEKVFLEVMNEPNAETPQAWDRVQVELIKAIRLGAPHHTIIASSNVSATANDWNNARSLPMTRIVADKNVVYNFHFYEPFVFTHQGASWGWRATQFMKNIPYPATLATVTPLLNAIQDPEAKKAVEHYAQQQWNRDKLITLLSPIAHWAKTNNVPVSCNEFGAIPWTAPRSSLLRYLQDVRQVLESFGIGWGQWFELDVRDVEVMQALGLKPIRN
ncbi:glycoside hydrolase family 5 protein [Chroococcidiopsis sp. TS-821]|uniref:glycoside hydrolase family 5 protein n=1 Tax=Chroococcidiopsis sp. TS-821 TaxID=1378066 RepID=UPI000CEDD2E5|nr:cellulase family glycosylhydrolase [Chroococcidiopsis sp. TS-821]PPS43414.1 cellulase [Chroococcidiopsis sp. TS-821]